MVLFSHHTFLLSSSYDDLSVGDGWLLVAVTGWHVRSSADGLLQCRILCSRHRHLGMLSHQLDIWSVLCEIFHMPPFFSFVCSYQLPIFLAQKPFAVSAKQFWMQLCVRRENCEKWEECLYCGKVYSRNTTLYVYDKGMITCKVPDMCVIIVYDDAVHFQSEDIWPVWKKRLKEQLYLQ